MKEVVLMKPKVMIGVCVKIAEILLQLGQHFVHH
jgi:hypothetical protein